MMAKAEMTVVEPTSFELKRQHGSQFNLYIKML